MLNIEFAAAKVNKYASRESGDTVEVIERPTAPGGFTIVLADGQGSGRNAKTLSQLVTSRCVALLKEGVRDGAVARAVSDHLYAYRHGQVSATLNLISADFVTRSLVITRNNPEPVYLVRRKLLAQPDLLETSEQHQLDISTLDEPSVPIGIYPRTRPVIQEVELEAGLIVIAFSDGISGAGTRYDEKIDLVTALPGLFVVSAPDLGAQAIADKLLELALHKDRLRPQDDMSVVVVTTNEFEAEDGAPIPRRLNVQLSLQ